MITQITDLNGTAAEKTQPLISPILALGAHRLSCLLVVDVGGRQIRTEDDLKNPSTTVHAQSPQLQRHHWVRRPTVDGASRKWAAKKWVTRPASPP